MSSERDRRDVRKSMDICIPQHAVVYGIFLVLLYSSTPSLGVASIPRPIFALDASLDAMYPGLLRERSPSSPQDAV